jgi:hypothetical protein
MDFMSFYEIYVAYNCHVNKNITTGLSQLLARAGARIDD